MKIIESYAKKNRCYTNNIKITVKGLMLHSVGCPQPEAAVFMKNWNNVSAGTCVHAVLGEDGTVYQLLPWDIKAWHCGSGSRGSGNNSYIGVEMTEPSTIQYMGGASFYDRNPAETKRFIQETYRHAVDLFTYLCRKFSLSPMADGVIISHSEGGKRGIASNHGDVEHIWNKFGITMNQFRNDVNASLKSEDPPESDIPHQAESGEDRTDMKPYTVKISTDVLNVRNGPGLNYTAVSQVKKNEVYTIIDEVTADTVKWGKLKSGAGYICLTYAQRS